MNGREDLTTRLEVKFASVDLCSSLRRSWDWFGRVEMEKGLCGWVMMSVMLSVGRHALEID